MGAARLKSYKNEREIFLSFPRLSYVSPKCVNQPLPDPTVPRAYLKYIHYDQDSQFVSMGYMPISDEANEGYQQLLLQLVAQEDGFVQFFVANETLRDVYFDDITGMVRRPKIIQEGHYNPFGLPLAGLTTLGNPEYAYFFTGKELYEDEALQWYDYGARMYDVQIGRWTTHDPLYQDASPYIFCGNNGVNYVDIDGRAWTALDFGLTIMTGGLYAVGKLTYESFIKDTQFDRWLAKNEKTITSIGFVVAGVGLSFIPGVNVLGAAAIAGGLAGLQAGVSTYQRTGGNLQLAFESFAVQGAITFGTSLIAGGIGKEAFNGSLKAYTFWRATAKGALSGASSGAFNGLAQGLTAKKNIEGVMTSMGRGALIGLTTGAAIGMVSGAYQVHKENAALRKAFKAQHPELAKEANTMRYYRGRHLKSNGMIGKNGGADGWGLSFGNDVRIAPAAKYNSEVFHLTMGHEGLHAKGFNNEWWPNGSGLEHTEHLNIYQWELNTAKHFNFSQDVINDIQLRMQYHHNQINSEIPWDQFEKITNWSFGVYP